MSWVSATSELPPVRPFVPEHGPVAPAAGATTADTRVDEPTISELTAAYEISKSTNVMDRTLEATALDLNIPLFVSNVGEGEIKTCLEADKKPLVDAIRARANQALASGALYTTISKPCRLEGHENCKCDVEVDWETTFKVRSLVPSFIERGILEANLSEVAPHSVTAELFVTDLTAPVGLIPWIKVNKVSRPLVQCTTLLCGRGPPRTADDNKNLALFYVPEGSHTHLRVGDRKSSYALESAVVAERARELSSAVATFQHIDPAAAERVLANYHDFTNIGQFAMGSEGAHNYMFGKDHLFWKTVYSKVHRKEFEDLMFFGKFRERPTEDEWYTKEARIPVQAVKRVQTIKTHEEALMPFADLEEGITVKVLPNTTRSVTGTIRGVLKIQLGISHVRLTARAEKLLKGGDVEFKFKDDSVNQLIFRIGGADESAPTAKVNMPIKLSRTRWTEIVKALLEQNPDVCRANSIMGDRSIASIRALQNVIDFDPKDNPLYVTAHKGHFMITVKK